jgi:hypothetical protein
VVADFFVVTVFVGDAFGDFEGDFVIDFFAVVVFVAVMGAKVSC